MGDDISKVRFEPSDYTEFGERLRDELARLRQWSGQQRFAAGEYTAGLELEAWLLEPDGTPAPDNGQFLESLAKASVVPELAKFNFELNVQPQPIAGLGLENMQRELLNTWQLCGERAADLNRRITCVGIPPTVTQEMLCAQNMTPRSRFEALNRQVLRLRHGEPIRLYVEGIDALDVVHQDVMLEAAATSLQVHMKVPLEEASRYYNALVIASAATVACAANAPLVFGRRLWHDSRIAVFEQAVDTCHPLRRVSFGHSYAGEDFLSLFDEKVEQYPVLLPVQLDDPPDLVPHLRLHNGTLWMWNRPLIGFESDGSPHVRIEHRVMSAGPTAVDMFANVALALGLGYALANYSPTATSRIISPVEQCDFSTARENFYSAARYGLEASVAWRGRRYVLRQLLLDQWLPLARAGLAVMQVDRKLIDTAEAILRQRVSIGQTAAVWQLAAFDRHRGNVAAVFDEYLTNQATKKPVHEW